MHASASATDDGSRISAHFLNTALKNSAHKRFEADSHVNTGLDKRGGEATAAYLKDLTVSRSAFLSKLDSSAADTDAELDDSADAYLSLLLGLVNSYTEADSPAALDQETGGSGRVSIVHSLSSLPPPTMSIVPADARLQALLGAGPTRINANDEHAALSQQMQGNAPGRHCVAFEWQDVLVTTAQSSTADTVYELASALVATAVWKQRRAVYLCQGGKQGTSNDAAIKVGSNSPCAMAVCSCVTRVAGGPVVLAEHVVAIPESVSQNEQLRHKQLSITQDTFVLCELMQLQHAGIQPPTECCWSASVCQREGRPSVSKRLFFTGL